jgi:hypothetical protein
VAPFALVAAWLAVRALRDAPQDGAAKRVDYVGAALVTLGLAGAIALLINGPVLGFGQRWVLTSGIAGVVLLVMFVLREARATEALLPLELFRSRTFTGTNLTTLLVYAALSGLFFLLMLQLQNGLGWTPLQAGASLLPINVLMVGLSPLAGQLASRGDAARWLMTGGASTAGVGMLLFTRVQPGASFITHLLPALLVFGIGLTAIVAPLTATVLAAAPDDRKGVASAFNNAVARLAALLATAILPLAAGMGGIAALEGDVLVNGYARAMRIASALCFAGGAVALVTVRTRAEEGG